MSVLISKGLLMELVGGRGSPALADLVCQGLEFSSREIEGGEIFIALRGEKRHGQEYLADAFKRGASVAIVEDDQLLTGEYSDKVIVVNDSYRALQEIAKWWRAKLPIRVMAITGSVGKTTTKELCGGILSSFFSGSYSVKSFNNHIGVPYTVCQIESESSWAVCEVGTNHPGEIEPLVKIVRPDVSIITAVAAAHIEYFGTISAIVDEKLKIASCLAPEGILVVNGDSPELDLAVSRCKLPHIIRRFGTLESNDLVVSELKLMGGGGSEFVATFQGEREKVKLGLFGHSSISNAAAAILGCCSLYPSLEFADICCSVSHVKPPELRLNLIELAGGRRVLNDCYNANPASMSSALETLAGLAQPNERVGLVLGDMRELGEQSEYYHREIAQIVATVPQLSELITVGKFAHHYADELKSSGIKVLNYGDTAEAELAVREMSSDLILFKGSRGVALESLVSLLS